MTDSSSLRWVQANRQRPCDARRCLHAIVSSRIGRSWLRFPEWLSAVKWVVQRLNPVRDQLLIAPGMTTTPLVEYWARRIGIPLIGLDQKCADGLVTQLADRVFALAVRADGNVEQCLQRRLQSTTGRTCWLLLNEQLTDIQVTQRLLRSGAIGWTLPANEQTVDQRIEQGLCPIRESSTLVSPFGQQFDAGRFLFHWTREPLVTTANLRRGLHRENDWWLGQPLPAQGPLATLWQILTERRLRGSSVGIRAGCPVVCFTQIPPQDWPKLRKFQSHRGRWDFVPYGLALDRSKLAQMGCQPVVYGDHSGWEKLEADRRPFFQKTAAPDVPDGMVWTHEREWRVIGDVNLSFFGTEELLVFVPTMAEAQWLGSWSRWPVGFLNE